MFASSSVDWYDVIYDNAGPSWIGVEVLWGWVGIWSALLVPVSVEFGHSYFSVLLSWSLFSCLLCFLGLIVAFSLPWFFESGLFCPLLYLVILFSFYSKRKSNKFVPVNYYEFTSYESMLLVKFDTLVLNHLLGKKKKTKGQKCCAWTWSFFNYWFFGWGLRWWSLGKEKLTGSQIFLLRCSFNFH